MAEAVEEAPKIQEGTDGAQKEKVPLKTFLSALSGRQWLTFGVLYLANFCSAMTFSCIVPFFPTEARLKGLSMSQVGLIIGVFQLAMFAASPLLGRFISQIGPNRMFTGGLVISAVGAMLYSLLNFFPSATAFFIAAMLFRCATALGNAAFRTSSLTLIASNFPKHVASVVGMTGTSMSIGYTVGPTIGSGLYELGGFSLPFLVLGSLILLSALISFLILLFGAENNTKTGKEEDVNAQEIVNKESKSVGFLRVLRIPEVALTLVSLFALELSMFFYDASLTEHVKPLSTHSSLLAGLLLSTTSLICMFSAPLWGILIDRFGCFQPLMLAGTVMGFVFPLLMGPSPLLPIDLSIPSLGVSFALQGLAVTTLHTPSFKFCIEGAKKQGFPENDTGITGCISGLLNGAVALGAFVGVTIGGLSVQWIGFEQTSTLAGAVHLVPFTIQMVLLICGRNKR